MAEFQVRRKRNSESVVLARTIRNVTPYSPVMEATCRNMGCACWLLARVAHEKERNPRWFCVKPSTVHRAGAKRTSLPESLCLLNHEIPAHHRAGKRP